jgi:hypothetical protein
MYRSPLLGDPRRRGLPGGGGGPASGPYYGASGAARPLRTARFASALLLLAITLGALMAQKVLVCDVDAADAAEREAALVQSLKRLQGSLASRNAQGGGSFTAYQARAARTADAVLHAPRKPRTPHASLAAPASRAPSPALAAGDVPARCAALAAAAPAATQPQRRAVPAHMQP